jgi:hypothetical protein
VHISSEQPNPISAGKENEKIREVDILIASSTLPNSSSFVALVEDIDSEKVVRARLLNTWRGSCRGQPKPTSLQQRQNNKLGCTNLITKNSVGHPNDEK